MNDRKTKLIKNIMNFHCSVGDHYLPKDSFYRNKATKWGIASVCKGCFSGMCKTKWKKSQMKGQKEYQEKRSNALRRQKAFDNWRFRFLQEVITLENGILFVSDSQKLSKLREELIEI